MSYTKENLFVPCKQRRSELSSRLKVMSTWDMNYTALAKEFGVSRQQISKDVRVCLTEVHREDLLEVCHNVKRTIEEAVRVSMRLLRSNDDNIRARGVHAAVEACVAYMRLMVDISEDPIEAKKLTVEELNKVLNHRVRSPPSAARDDNRELPRPQGRPLADTLDELEELTDEEAQAENP